MLKTRILWYLPAMLALLVLAVAGCAPVGPVSPQVLKPVKMEDEHSRKGWWYARFQINWPQDAEPSWYMDTLLAHKVISPVLYQYRGGIDFWRFHRRAARDQAGHQFSFIFYSSDELAEHVYSAIKDNAYLKTFKAGGVIIGDSFDDPRKTNRPNIEDTSDGNWSPSIRRSWPHFIMGVSEMWLSLISEIAENNPAGENPSSTGEIQELYRRVHSSIEELWQKEGSHALLHHLNAIFGYEPVIVNEKRLIRF